jgi:hypothetical protein
MEIIYFRDDFLSNGELHIRKSKIADLPTLPYLPAMLFLFSGDDILLISLKFSFIYGFLLSTI